MFGLTWAGGGEQPVLRTQDGGVIRAEHQQLGTRWLYADAGVPVLVTGNETNNERVFGTANDTPHVKDGIDRAVVQGDHAAVNPAGTGTKAALHHVVTVPAGGSATVQVRLADRELDHPFADFTQVMATRREEADGYWAEVLAGDLTDSEREVCRQAFAGMLWSKQ